jgi:hypothetical protein
MLIIVQMQSTRIVSMDEPFDREKELARREQSGQWWRAAMAPAPVAAEPQEQQPATITVSQLAAMPPEEYAANRDALGIRTEAVFGRPI